jgi:hypothetical protein
MWTCLGILASIGTSWFFAEWYPRVSTRFRENQLHKTTRNLHEYEKEFADIRLFITRILRIASLALTALLFTAISFQIVELATYSQMIMCKLSPDACRPLSEVSINLRVFQWLNFLAAFWLALVVRKFGLEIRPDKYRSYMNDRIARLSSRLKAG